MPQIDRIAAQCMAPVPGRSTTMTPTKPTQTAAQRRMPTFSPSIGPASAVTSSGAENMIALVSASCR